MRHDFDEIIDRTGTYCTQWDYASDRFGRSDVLPFSISDTDFAMPAEIRDAMARRLEHPIFGYTRWNHDDYKGSIVDWFARRHNAEVDASWVVYSPSVIFSAAALVRLTSAPGEGVVTLAPMYDAFFAMIGSNGRKLVSVGVASAQDGYGLDWDGLERAVSDPCNRVLLLTNPHNPTGKVFSREELERIFDLCHRNGVFLISDDIHGDIVYGPASYVPITEVGLEGVAIVSSSSKTFNTPGLIGSYVLCPDASLRQRLLFELKQRNALSSVSVMGMVAQMAAYTRCDDYVDDMIAYLDSNMGMVEQFVSERIPALRFCKPQGTYLAWIDASGLGLSDSELQDGLVNVGHVGIMSGATYGSPGYLRMNVACPASKLSRGLDGLLAGARAKASC